METNVFKNELNTFKKKVEEEIKSFFGMTPEQVSSEIENMRNEYGSFLDLDKDTYRDVFTKGYKDILMKYKTLVYFDGIYTRLLDIEKFCEDITNDGE